MRQYFKTSIVSENDPTYVEPERRKLYDSIYWKVDEADLNIDLFYSNPSYFKYDDVNSPIPLKGSHPSLLHWPLSGYQGGNELIISLEKEKAFINDTAGDQNISWIDTTQWHSTVFSPVHSSDPTTISKFNTDFRDLARKEVSKITTYMVTFTRLIITIDGGILALGYASSEDLDLLRNKLLKSVPHGHAPQLIHVSLGHFICNPSVDALNKLKHYISRYITDQTIIGRIQVKFLCYAMYFGPFLKMSVKTIEQLSLSKSI